ncbi:MAG: Alpha/beta hydrolase family protein [Syntrophorhabdus sp. PtaB.Bin006]|nr:MAG: Alpha/beta hydrolase family protein [Syntrophorhabdus sp. PtaB.Bin006]
MQTVSIPIVQSNSSLTTDGKIYGSRERAVIFSNMDTNNQNEWSSIIELINSNDCMFITYNYVQYEVDQSTTLDSVVSFAKNLEVKQIILVGASRGGVASIKVAANMFDKDHIVGVVALSAPIEHEGIVFYNSEELSRIRIPKLLVNSESDECVAGTFKMYQLVNYPKELLIYSGEAHGTEIFLKDGKAFAQKLNDFISSVFKNIS